MPFFLFFSFLFFLDTEKQTELYQRRWSAEEDCEHAQVKQKVRRVSILLYRAISCIVSYASDALFSIYLIFFFLSSSMWPN